MGKVMIDDLFFLYFGITQKDDTNRNVQALFRQRIKDI